MRLSLAEGARRPRAVRESVVGDVEANMATVPSRTGDVRPVRPPVATPASGFGGSGPHCGHTPSRRRYVGVVWSGRGLGRLLGVGVLLGRLLGVGHPVVVLGRGCSRLGRLPGVGFSGSRPGKAAQCSECLEARRPDNFFRRTRGSRLGYPWPFTPTVVPEADWASRWSGDLRSSISFLS